MTGREPSLKSLGTAIFKGQTDREEAMKKDQKDMNRDKGKQQGKSGVM